MNSYIAALGVNPGGLWNDIRSFFTDFDQMFPGFADVVVDATAPFYVLSFGFILYHLVKQLSSAHGDGHMRAIASAAAFSLVVAFCIPIVNQLDTAFKDLANQVGYSGSPQALTDEMEEMLYNLTEGTSQSQEGQGESEHGFLYYVFHPGAAADSAIDGIVGQFYAIIIQAAIFICTLFYKAVQVLMWALLALQRFLILLNSIFLPTMVAMIAVGAVSSIGVRYVMSMVGVLAWPLGWAFVNTGTEALMESVSNSIANAGGAYAPLTYLWAIAICCVIPFWIAFGYMFAPFVIGKMVTTGAAAAQGMIGATAGTTARVAGMAAVAGIAAATGGTGAVAAGGLKGASGAAGGVGDGGVGDADESRSSSSEKGSSSRQTQAAASVNGSRGSSLAGSYASSTAQLAANAVATPMDRLAADEGHSPGFGPNYGAGAGGDASSSSGMGSQSSGRKSGGPTGSGSGGGTPEDKDGVAVAQSAPPSSSKQTGDAANNTTSKGDSSANLTGVTASGGSGSAPMSIAGAARKRGMSMATLGAASSEDDSPPPTIYGPSGTAISSGMTDSSRRARAGLDIPTKQNS